MMSDDQTSLTSILSAADSHARTSAQPVTVPESSRATGAGSGTSLPESFASYDPDTSSWRTCQFSLLGGLESFSEIWPMQGTMQNGAAYQQPPWVRHTSENESSLWPTARATDGDKGSRTVEGARRELERGRNVDLGVAVRCREKWPTPRARDHKGCGVNGRTRDGVIQTDTLDRAVWFREKWPTLHDALIFALAQRDEFTTTHRRRRTRSLELIEAEDGSNRVSGGSLNPTWVEWLMGFPPGWTDLEP